MTHFLQPSISLRSLRKGFQFSCSSSFLHSNSIGLRSFSCKMSADSPIPSESITIPCQLDQPVQILAAPGVSDSDFRNAIDSSLFKQWLMDLQSESGILAKGAMSLKRVLIQVVENELIEFYYCFHFFVHKVIKEFLVQGVDMFGNKIGFLKFKADIYDKQTGKKVPGIVFARGPAVAVLILLSCEGETYAVLTEQVRVPVGKLMLELPAGMLDDDKGDFLGTAVREVEEEIGIQLKLEDMVDLTSFLDPATGCRVFPSPGGCDEGIGLFLYRGSASKETIAELQGKQTGLRDHGELIKVHVVPYEKLWRITADAKALVAIALYEMAQKEGLLPSLKPC